MFKKTLKIILILSSLSACSTKPIASNAANDPNAWLEEIESPRSLEFAKTENEKTFSVIKTDPHFKLLESELRTIAYAEDRIPWSSPMKGKYYNFWKDQKNARGLWRRTTLNEYKKNKPSWENIIDLDQLSKDENENWVWHGAQCLPPKYERCLISLSRGGKDAAVVREFDLQKKQFVKDGFFIPEAKTGAHWIDENSLFVGTDNGPGSLTDSGYARTVKYLKRGTKLVDAPIVFEIDKKDQSAGAYIEYTPKKNYQFFVHRYSFYQGATWYFENGKKSLIPMPKDSDFYGYFHGYLLYVLKSELANANKKFKSGSLVALPLNSIGDESLASLELIFEPTQKKYLQTLSTTRNHLLLEIMDNIQGKIIDVTFVKPNAWKLQNLILGKNGVASIESTQMENDDFQVTYSDFFTPTLSYLGNSNVPHKRLVKIKTSPERFNSKNFTSEQRFAKSKDGTLIPYFIVHNKNIKYDGKNPTLLYGYGGFESSQQPYYLSSVGKIWLERGGVYVLANIRGGGEFGPAWHQAALKENHQVVFDDFISIAEDLIKEKITTPKHLGIQGGSNGGLLVGGTFIQRPDLFNAVLCEVPLLDMLKYHTLLAGASWMDEYGNPEDPKMREVISKYSPYQNVKAGVTYPEVFFFTSTKDDRVHPSHARKMVAKMRSMGHPLFYYENTEGGHGGVANIEQAILKGALEFTYLWRKLE